MLGLDDGGEDGGEGGAPLAEVIGGVERGHGLHVLVVPQLIGKLIDGERPRHGEPVPLLEPQLPRSAASSSQLRRAAASRFSQGSVSRDVVTRAKPLDRATTRQ